MAPVALLSQPSGTCSFSSQPALDAFDSHHSGAPTSSQFGCLPWQSAGWVASLEPQCRNQAPAPLPSILPSPAVPATYNELRLFQECHLGEMVGEGRYGAVWECTHRATGAMLACKQVDKDSSPDGAVELELACLAGVQGHPNVLHLERVYEGKKSVYLVMEMCNSGDLYDHICEKGHLSECDARALFRQIVAAVSHCHARGVVHRDLKPENVLLHQCPATGQVTVRLADFGLATVLGEGGRAVGWVGSKPYEAPEVVAHEEYDYSADVFSMGVLLYSMLSGNWPSFTKDKQLLTSKSFGYSRWNSVSAEAKELITRMLSHDPEMRPTAAAALQDVWFYLERQDSVCTEELAWGDNSSSLSSDEMELVLRDLLGSEGSEVNPVAGGALELDVLDLELHL